MNISLFLFVRKIAICIIGIGLAVVLQCQESEIDSLEKALLAVNSNANKLDLLLTLCDKTYRDDPEKTLQYANRAEALNSPQAEIRILRWKARAYLELQNWSMMKEVVGEIIRSELNIEHASAYNLLSGYHRNVGRLDSASYFGFRALEIQEKLGDYSRASLYYNDAALPFCMKGDLQTCDSLFNLGYEAAKKMGESHRVMNMSYNLGSLSIMQGNPEKAVDYYTAGLKEARKLKESNMEAGFLSKLAIDRTRISRSQSDEYHDQAVDIIRKSEAKPIVSYDVYYNAIEHYWWSDRQAKANVLSKELLSIADFRNDVVMENIAKAYIASYHCKISSLDSCRVLIDELLVFLKSNSKDVRTLNIYNVIPEPLNTLEMDDELERSLPYYKKYAFSVDASSVREKYFYEKYNLEKRKGQLDSALASHEQYVMYRDSFHFKNLNETIVEARTKFETDQEELKNQLLSDRNQLLSSRNRMLTFFLILIALASAVLVYFIRLIRKSNKTIFNQKLELEHSNSTKNKLFAIISHDLRNEISALRFSRDKLEAIAQEEGSNNLREFSERFAQSIGSTNSLVDNILHWATDQFYGDDKKIDVLNLSENAEQVSKSLQTYADERKITVDLSGIDASHTIRFDTGNFEFCLRTLMHNAIKFSPSDSVVRVKSSSSRDFTILEVLDQGIGMSASQISDLWKLRKDSTNVGVAGDKGAGIALSLVNDIISQTKVKIEINSEMGKGSVFRMIFPKTKLQ